MLYILNKRYDQTFNISFLGTETLTQTNNRIVLETTDFIKGVVKFTTYDYSVSGDNNLQNIKVFYSYISSKKDQSWSTQKEIGELSNEEFCKDLGYKFRFFIYRIDEGENQTPTDITFSDLLINGEFSWTTSDSIIVLTKDDKTQIIKPKDIYKIFKLEDFQVITSSNPSSYNVKFRITQDDGKTYTKWEELTKDNLSTLKVNKLRFARVEYLFENLTNSNVKIYDVLLIGDFQNVSANGLKVNKYGLKEDCLSQIKNQNSGYTHNMNYSTYNLSCYGDPISQLNSENEANSQNFWNPYESTKITQFGNMLANQIKDIFGFNVDYYLTDPNVGGQDSIIHEYQLFNVISNKRLKVLVPENNFPDNTINFNTFNLELFDTFEIHITKDEFKNKFGIEKRPSQQDFLYFCEVNRMYRVKHAQVFKSIMNAGIYYKVILEKYEQKANIIFDDSVVKEKHDNLVKNTTIDELFGFEREKEMDKISNKDQLYPKTFDKIRLKVNDLVKIEKEKIYNGQIDFIESYYNLYNTPENITAVEYINGDKVLNKGENRTMMVWFNFNNLYSEDKALTKKVYDSYNVDHKKMYNLLDNYKDVGYKLFYNNNKLTFTLNNNSYVLNLTGDTLKTNIWYCAYVKLEQRQKLVDIRLYTRNTYSDTIMFNVNTYEKEIVESNNTTEYDYLISQGFKPVNNEENLVGDSTFILKNNILYENVEPVSFTHDESIKIFGSNVKLTNVRLFNDIIEEENLFKVMNQLIIKDAGYLIFADNGYKKIQATDFKNTNFR